MRIASIACAALVAAFSPSFANDKKKKEPEPPPPAPVVGYETDDPHMGEPLVEACLKTPVELETYDSRDNVAIVGTSEGRAFLHLKGACTPNVMIFAQTVATEDGGQCVKPGNKLVFSSSYGDKVACEVTGINRWLDDEPIVDD